MESDSRGGNKAKIGSSVIKCRLTQSARAAITVLILLNNINRGLREERERELCGDLNNILFFFPTGRKIILFLALRGMVAILCSKRAA